MLGQSRPSQAFIAAHLIGTGLFWGSSFIFIKLMRAEVPPLMIAAWRGLFAGAALAIFVMILRQSPLPRRSEWFPWIVLGLINGFLPNVLVAYALTELPAGPGAMIQATAPLFTAMFAHMAFADERLNLRKLAGIALGLAGVGLLAGASALEKPGAILPALAMLATAMLYALGNIFIRTIKNTEPIRLALGQQSFSALFGCASLFAATGPGGFLAPLEHVPLLIAVGVISTALPIALFMRLIRAAGPTIASMTGYMVPAFATLLGVLALGERLGARELIAALVILTGVYVASTARGGAVKA